MELAPMLQCLCISIIFARGSMSLSPAKSGSWFQLADLGFNLIASYEVIDKELVEPQLRSSIESKVNLIAQ